jgi:hypothetical protein
MRSMLTLYPVRRTSIRKSRRKGQTDSFGKMLGKLSAASDRLARARRAR